MMLTTDQYKAIKRMSYGQLAAYLTRLYREAFIAGLREAEQEFDDPEKYQIVSEDDARQIIGDEAYDKLTAH